MRLHLPIAMTVVALLLCLPAAGCGSDEASGGSGGASGKDAALESAALTPCAQRGGVCVAGFPDSTVPGFTVMCQPGYALDDGTTELTAGGNDIIHSSLALGCSTHPDGTGTPALCCLPVDAGDAAAGP
jgi:hypothetical protein